MTANLDMHAGSDRRSASCVCGETVDPVESLKFHGSLAVDPSRMEFMHGSTRWNRLDALSRTRKSTAVSKATERIISMPYRAPQNIELD